jgi:hypothetical protein
VEGKVIMSILTQTELNPLQEARRCAEEHLETIRATALAYAKLPHSGIMADEADLGRYHKLAEIVGALQTIYDNVSELEFEEEAPPEPPSDPEPEEEDDPEDDEEDEDEDEDGEED